MTAITKHSEYRDWLRDLKQQIKTGQVKAALSVNSQLIALYWDLGRQITEKQKTTKWGSGFIDQLSKDLSKEFPEMTGFSAYNLRFTKIFYTFYSSIWEQPVPKLTNKLIEQPVQLINPQVEGKLQFVNNPQIIKSGQLVPQLILVPWGHHVLMLKKFKDVNQAIFYVNKTIENNWSRAVLEYQIETNLYGRQGKAVTNFNMTLPKPQSDLANEMMKDPYNFGFLRLSEKVVEADIEKALVSHISQFLPELGFGFAYMGQQYKLKIGEKEYRTDLLFYHTRLRCYVIIELKAREFEPEFVGKLNFYISAVNELVKGKQDKPTIGILLCKNKNNYEVEFALRDVKKPIGVSSFHYTELTDEMKAVLPSDKTLQIELLNFEREHGKSKNEKSKNRRSKK